MKSGFSIMIIMMFGFACSKAPETSTNVKKKLPPAFTPSSIASEADAEEKENSYPIIAALPEEICSDITYRDATGVLKIGRRACSGAAACTMNGEKNCLANADYPAVDLSGSLLANLSKIHHNLTIFELEGAMPDCSTTGETSCYTAPGTAAVNPSAIDPSKMLSGYSLLGVTGTLPTCSNATKQNCLVPVGRKAAHKCVDGNSDCYLPPYSLGIESLKAFNVSTLSASDIKVGVTIGGVLGTYPSAAVPLAGSADGNPDLLSTTFHSQMQSASTFGWFDRTGARHTASGDADLLATNLLQDVEVFGVTGNVVIPDEWDVRAGTVVGQAAGRMKMNCRSGYDLSTFDIALPKRATAVNDGTDIVTVPNHGFQNDDEVQIVYTNAPSGLSMGISYYVIALDGDNLQLASAPLGAAIDFGAGATDLVIFRMQDGTKSFFDSIDYVNNNGPQVSSASGTNESNFCADVYPASPYGIWEDVTIGSCNSLSDDCVYRDRITKLQWSETFAQSHFSYAHSRCAQLNFNGHSDWRLPTQKELLTAATHNMRSVNKALWMDLSAVSATFWTSTAISSTNNIAVYPGYVVAVPAARASLSYVSCVRGGM